MASASEAQFNPSAPPPRRKGLLFAVLAILGTITALCMCSFVAIAIVATPGPRVVAHSGDVTGDLRAAIDGNSGLRPRNRRDCLQLAPIINDDPYLDRAAFLERIRTLQVDYVNPVQESIESGNAVDNISGRYVPRLNTITMYAEYAETDEADLTRGGFSGYNTYAHELGHLVFDKACSRMPTFLSEGVAVQVDVEYFETDVTGGLLMSYDRYMAAFRALTELVGRDVMLKAVSTGRTDILIREMAKIHGDSRQARDVIALLNTSNQADSMETGTLVKALAPYFAAKYGSDWGGRRSVLGAYDKAFALGWAPSGWPDRYYLNRARGAR